LDFVWKKPVLVFYKERLDKPERKAFAVIKANKFSVSRNRNNEVITGEIREFFPLMGDIDYISTKEGKSDQYILCWFEDREDDLSKAWRRLTNVTFPKGLTFTTDKKDKRTYTTEFRAKQGKL
jgi:hypothetical protein